MMKAMKTMEILSLANANNRYLTAKFLKENEIAEGNLSLTKASRIIKSLAALVNTYIVAADLTTDEKALDTLYAAIGERLSNLYAAWDMSSENIVPARDVILRAVTMKKNDDDVRVLSSKVGASFAKVVQLAVVNHAYKIASAESIVSDGMGKARDAENGTKKNVTTRKPTKAELMEIMKSMQAKIDALENERKAILNINAKTAEQVAAC